MLKEKPYKVTLILDQGAPSMTVQQTLDYHRTYSTWPHNHLLRKLTNLWNNHIAGQGGLTEEQVVLAFQDLVEEHYGHLVQEVVYGNRSAA